MAANPPTCDFGWKASEFALPSTEGNELELQQISGPNGTLIMFICNHCPYVVSVIDRIVNDSKAIQELGVGVAAICSNDAATYPEDSFPNMVRFAENAKFTFPYLHDENQTVAKKYGAACTPDFFGFNSELALQYRGRLDSAGRQGKLNGNRRELYEAMKMISETGQGPRSQIASMGCSIKWK